MTARPLATSLAKIDASPIEAPVLVGLSGGLDSTVLLHLLAAHPAARARGLRAVHVHHGLNAQADAWATHCVRVCDALGIALTVRHVEVQLQGDGPEAAARRARRAAFAESLDAGEILALAHHRDDQAETFLLRALRASGPDGLAAMRPWTAFAAGWLWRPLLDTPRAALLAYARAHGLDWIDDPSNADDALDRNFLRHRVLPLLHERWPQANAALARAADLQAQAVALLDEDDAQALTTASLHDPATLSVERLDALPAPRRARVLRAWIARLHLPPLPAQGVEQIERDLLPARPDADACFAWCGAEVRRWRGLLHAQSSDAALPADWSVEWHGDAPLRLPGDGSLHLECDDNAARNDEGMSANAFRAMPDALDRQMARIDPGTDSPGVSLPWRVHARRGGERIVLPGRAHSHTLKHALQDAGVPPWERRRLPLVSARDGTLLAAGDGLLSAPFDAWLRAHGLRLRWQRRTPADDIRATPLR